MFFWRGKMKITDVFSCEIEPMDRRSFLKLSGILGFGMASAGIIPMTAEAVRFNKKLYKVSETRLAMGTFVSMTLIHHNKDQAEEAIGMAFHEIHRLTGLLNRFDDRTAVAQLNKDGYLNDIPSEMTEVVAAALHYHQMSQGAFDITVKPLVDLFEEKLGGKNQLFPTQKEMKQALNLVGSQKIRLDERKMFFQKPGMGITLDGIAKGYVVDRVSQLLSKHKIENHLINAGGDIRTSGAKGDNRPWKVAIEDPSKTKNYPDIIEMRDGAVATSGNYEIFYDREKMFHHIVDPSSGLSPDLKNSVSVRAETTMEADALSTSVFVMNPERGIEFMNALPRCEGLVVAKDGTLLKSRGWKSAAK
jgi:thiamine biosynthesis lipoprotein